MSAREKIAEILHGKFNGKYTEAADAILAALPDMIPDLVWEPTKTVDYYFADSVIGRYVVTSNGDGWKAFNARIITPVFCSNEAKAKAAANAHHKAQLARAMGWTV